MKKWKRKKRNGRKEMRGACGSEKNWGRPLSCVGVGGRKEKGNKKIKNKNSREEMEPVVLRVGRHGRRENGRVGGVVGEEQEEKGQMREKRKKMKKRNRNRNKIK